MYINGVEYSSTSTVAMLGGVPFLFESLDWKISKIKKQNKANYSKVVSVTYGVETVDSINISMTQQQANAIRKSATSQKLTDMPPMNLVILMSDGASKLTKFVFSDFEFTEDALDSNTSDDPTMKCTVACIASDLQTIGV